MLSAKLEISTELGTIVPVPDVSVPSYHVPFVSCVPSNKSNKLTVCPVVISDTQNSGNCGTAVPDSGAGAIVIEMISVSVQVPLSTV